MSDIILKYLPYLFAAARAVPQVMDFIQRTRDNLKQTGQWTQEQEDAFNKEIADLQTNPPDWWKPESA